MHQTSSASTGRGERVEEPLSPGETAGRYVILHKIASGGCGTVYRARHLDRGDDAAVKVLHGSLAVLPKMVERFAREVRVAPLLRHPNIVAVHDVGTLPDGRPYFAMEYVEGRTVARILDEQGRLTPAEALTLLGPVCAALDAVHAAGVIHRDVKASNIIVTGWAPPARGAPPPPPPGVKLLDFGIAKLVGAASAPGGLTTEGRQIGTLTIMAPEQLLGGPVDARIDIYALGILLFRLLTGRLPFDGRDALSLAQQHLEEPAPRPSQRTPLPPALDAIVLRCLEKQPSRRYATVGDFLAALRYAVTGSSRPAEAERAATRGLAVYVELRTLGERAEVDDALDDDLGLVLDTAEEALREAGFLLASATGSDVLGVLPLPAAAEGARAGRQRAIDVAVALRRALDARPGADPRLHVNIAAHADEVLLRGDGRAEVAGGRLVRTGLWVPAAEVRGVCATPEAMEGVAGHEAVPGPGARVTIVS